MKTRVVITGFGVVSPLAMNARGTIESALAGVSGIRRCDERLWGEFGEGIRCRVGGTVPGFDAKDHVPEEYARRYDRSVVYALVAAREALQHAVLAPEAIDRERTGVMVGTAVTGNDSWHETLRLAFAERRASDIPGWLVTQISGNMPSALVALEHGFRGPNVAVVNACATGGASISVAADLIRAGRADVMLAGGTEAAIGLAMYASFVNAGAANPTQDPERASRPFSLDRAGFVKGEGAGIVVLESLSHALARKAKVHAELLGDSLTNDAHHIVRPDVSGERWAHAMGRALQDAGVSPEEVHCVSAHATSTLAGDLAETNAIKLLMGSHASRCPVFATKSMHGHLFGASGAVELIIAIGALSRGMLPPTMNLTVPDPACDLDYVPNVARPGCGTVLLKNSFGFGGTNSCIVVEVNRSGKLAAPAHEQLAV